MTPPGHPVRERTLYHVSVPAAGTLFLAKRTFIVTSAMPARSPT